MNIQLTSLLTRHAPKWARLLAPPPGTSWSGIGFAVRTTAASLIALYIAFLLGLDAPKWAAMTVWVVAQESRGMSLSKSKYRIAGTALGALMALALIALFSQTPELITLSLALWLGLCTGVATALRNFRAYGAVLAGYTASIIVMDAVAAPDQVFDIAIARITYILLGIIVEAVLAAIFSPGNSFNDARRQLDGYVRQAAAICARALTGEANDVALHQLFAKAINLHTTLEYAAAGSTAMKRRLGSFQACTAATLAQLAAARTLRAQLSNATRADALGLVGETQALLETIAANPSAKHLAVASLSERVKAACSREAAATSDLPSTYLILLDQLRVLLESLHQTLVKRDSLEHEQALPLAFHIDSVAAVHNGVRTFLSVFAAAFFCMVTGWSSGPGFVTIVAVVCSLFATRANPVAGGIGFMSGAAFAAIAAALCNFLLLPAVSNYSMLSLITGAFMVAAGLAMRHPRTAAPGASFAIFFWALISPQNTLQMIDAAGFFNGVLILLLGMACGTLIFALVFPSNPRATRFRLHRAVRRDLRHIGRHPNQWSPEGWLTRTADRLGRQLAAVDSTVDTQAKRDLRGLLGAWTIGNAAIALQRLAEDLHPVRRPVAVILGRLTDIDPPRLATTARSCARSFIRQSRGVSENKQQDLLSAAILSLAIAEAATEHGDFFGTG